MTWESTTHAWTSAVDHDHLRDVRARAAELSPGGVRHLVLEVLAYADEEAAERGVTGTAVVTLYPDGSVAVADDGRGTDTRYDEDGVAVRKPVMSTRDLRFYDAPDAPPLPDGAPRRGISVVAGLSRWLIHHNRRSHGAWTQRYEHGVPVTDLEPASGELGTGTTVHFRPDPSLAPRLPAGPPSFGTWPSLRVEVVDLRP